jgi:hypothetical protein
MVFLHVRAPGRYRRLVVERKDVEAALEARRELGREYEPELIDAFLEKIERRMPVLRERPQPHQGAITPLVLGSIALGIPVTAVALSNAPGGGGIAVAIVAWAAIGISNIAVAFFRFRR